MTTFDDAARILLVDDDLAFIRRANQALAPDFVVRIASTGSEALSTALIWKPDIVLFDLLMFDLDGFTFLDVLSDCSLDRRPFILCTTDGLGANTRVSSLPEWRVGTLLRSATEAQIRNAVQTAARGLDCRPPRIVTG